MDIWYYVLTPFTWLLTLFYNVFGNYGAALIVFALIVKLILFPFSLKGKRGMIQMNMLNGKIQAIQKKYANDRERQNLEVQKLYERENVNPMSGCLWTMVPLFVLFPLYAIIRQPMKYAMGLNPTQTDILTIVFKIADDEGLLLVDTKDLKSMLQYVAENNAQYSGQYGNIAKASINSILRGVVALESKGGEQFFTEPALNIADWFQILFIENNGMAYGMTFFNKLVLSLFRLVAIGAV